MRAHLTPQAEIDLEEIGDYIALDNPKRAVSFIREIRQHCEKIADGPRRYVARPDFALRWYQAAASVRSSRSNTNSAKLSVRPSEHKSAFRRENRSCTNQILYRRFPARKVGSIPLSFTALRRMVRTSAMSRRRCATALSPDLVRAALQQEARYLVKAQVPTVPVEAHELSARH